MPNVIGYIRFSTDQQAQGDSIQRQRERIDDFVASNPTYTLSDIIIDEGESAYTGSNINGGKFGRVILEGIKNNTIPPGTIISVENLDRISRLAPLHAFSLFSSILRSGIRIHVSSENRIYDESSSDLTSLIMPLLTMSRANEESQVKSDRVRKARERAREEARSSGKILTSRCPSWLEVITNQETGQKEFKIITCDNHGQDRAQIIKLMFNLANQGHGAYSIASLLNNTYRYKPFGRSDFFHKSFVTKVLTNHAVLGEYQPYTVQNKKRTPIGEPIPNYYPKIVDEELFYTINNRSRIRCMKGGRNGALNNLFSTLLKCQKCGSTMVFEDKCWGGKIVCSKAKAIDDTCEPIRINYSDYKGRHYLEYKLLRYLKEVSIDDISPNSEKEVTVTTLKESLLSLDERIARLYSDIDYTAEEITNRENAAIIHILRKKLEQKNSDVKKLLSQKHDVENQIGHYENEKGSEHIRQMHDIIALVNNEEDMEQRKIHRFKLRSILRSIIEKVVIRPLDPGQYMGYNLFVTVIYKSGRYSYLLTNNNGDEIFTDDMKLSQKMLYMNIETKEEIDTHALIETNMEVWISLIKELSPIEIPDDSIKDEFAA